MSSESETAQKKPRAPRTPRAKSTVPKSTIGEPIAILPGTNGSVTYNIYREEEVFSGNINFVVCGSYGKDKVNPTVATVKIEEGCNFHDICKDLVPGHASFELFKYSAKNQTHTRVHLASSVESYDGQTLYLCYMSARPVKKPAGGVQKSKKEGKGAKGLKKAIDAVVKSETQEASETKADSEAEAEETQSSKKKRTPLTPEEVPDEDM